MTLFNSTPASKPIENYALLGNGRTVALLARDGAVDLLCWPHFGSDAGFADLLGKETQGTWHVAPYGACTSTGAYCGDTLVLDTEFASKGDCRKIGDVTLSGLIQSEARLVLAGVRHEIVPAYATYPAARRRTMLRPQSCGSPETVVKAAQATPNAKLCLEHAGQIGA